MRDHHATTNYTTTTMDVDEDVPDDDNDDRQWQRAYGQEVSLQERTFEASAEKMNQDKRDKLRRKLDKIDAGKSLASLAVTDTS